MCVASNLNSGGDKMIAIQKLKGIIAENGLSQKRVADLLGMAPKTFYEKMKKGVFDSDEIEQMIGILNIDNPTDIFFASNKRG